jgi:trimeric autotransporter adhesin
LGFQALTGCTTGPANVCIGYRTGALLTTGDNNTAVGIVAMGNGTVTGSTNTALGFAALYSLTSGTDNLALGKDAGRTGSPGGQVTTGDKKIFIGDETMTAAHIQVDWTVASDARDKQTSQPLDLGLDFVKALAPVTYKWDKRSKYGTRLLMIMI